MVSYTIQQGTMYNTHKVTTVYRPEVGKHTWPGEQTCLMDYLHVIFGIRVRGSVTSFNSILPHVQAHLNVNHMAYIKYYNEDSTRNHISWYPWDKYSTPMTLAEIICLYGDVHWYSNAGPSHAIHTPSVHGSTHNEDETNPPPTFNSLLDLLPEWRHTQIRVPDTEYPPEHDLTHRLTQHLTDQPGAPELELAKVAVTEARGEAANYMHSNLVNMRDWVEAQTEPLWNQANRLCGLLDELVQKRIDTLEADVKGLKEKPAQGTTTGAEVMALINRIDQLEKELNALKNAPQATARGTTMFMIPQRPTEPPKFSGPKDHIGSKEWIQKMGMYFTDAKVMLEEDKVRQALLRLTGEAYQYMSP
ncbi:hypothetical protein WOLCODRAFT_150690 [Wolfiporia cocos MD-104 SS10]|uniref:Uncharacterized protein n=1 Tax=Wolfiporia cocos (strain MD-104) TaxID=742152 RepID=A0A2H3JFK1_WOLCO|nr:hypothetical protein WOLCODRAFT_150690 [Wolfiporia cocos MD-104 SS10]